MKFYTNLTNDSLSSYFPIIKKKQQTFLATQ